MSGYFLWNLQELKYNIKPILHYKGCYFDTNLQPSTKIIYNNDKMFYGPYIINIDGNTLKEAYENYLLAQL